MMRQRINRFLAMAVVLPASLAVAGCEVIGEIFEAGFWVGVVVVLLVLFFVWLLVRWLG